MVNQNTTLDGFLVLLKFFHVTLWLSMWPSQDVVKMENGYLWGGDRSVAGIERKSTVAHFVHPLKLGRAKHAELWLKYMEKQLNWTVRGYNSLG